MRHRVWPYHRARFPVEHLGSIGAPRVRLPARLVACGRARRSPTRSRTTSARARSCRCGSAAARRAASSSRSGSSRRPGSSSPRSGRCSTRSRRRSSTWRSGSPTTTARRRRARSSSSRRSAGRRAASGPRRPSASRFPASRARRRSRPSRAPPSPASSPGSTRRPDAHLLLVGPTGSGKTEVYLQACEAALARGLGTIVLVPEIALAPQTVGRFRERFGDTVAILHSALGQAERRDERDRIARGEARVVVGARSAIFAPMRDLGLVIVDEEHDSSYKQESDPRYDARTVAAKRAALEGAVAVYGSATPRPESWATLERVVLSARIGAPMPRVRIVDLRRESGYPLSAPLLTELGRVAERGRQGDPAAQPAGRDARDPLPRLRPVAPLRELRRRADAARRRRPALPSLRASRAGARDLPGLRLGRARAHRSRHAAAREGARAERARARADPARRRHRRAARGAARDARALPRAPTAPC